jgi:predicted PurR-regulated permease PerM
MRGTLILIATIVILAAAGYARFFLAPIAFALFIAALVWPLQSALQRHMPQLVALAIVTLTIVVVFLLFGSLIAWSFGRVGRGVINDAARFQVLYDQLTNWLESHGIVLARLWAEHFNASWLVRLVQSATTRLNTTLSFWIIVLIYLVLGLLEIDAFGQRVRQMSNQAAARVIHDGTEAAAAKLRSYMLVRTLMSLLTGFLVWVFAAAIGLNYAAEWGVIAFVLNYVPFIGSFVATLLPTLFALAQFASWQVSLTVFVCLNVIQFVVGSYIEPRVCGTVLAISPIVVLAAVFFWTFLWGLPGAFIGVPIVIVLMAFAGEHPSTRWLAELLGEGGTSTGNKVAP